MTAWNERQAKRMPMLFSPTIGAAITAGYWFLRARCPACRTTGDVDLRTLDWAPLRGRDGPYARAVVPILPAERAVCGISVPVEVERCRGVLRRAQRQQVGQRVNGQKGGFRPEPLATDSLLCGSRAARLIPIGIAH